MSGCVADTPSVGLAVAAGVLSANAKVSADPGNQLAIHADGLFSSGAPLGAVTFYAGTGAPLGWLVCDGSAVSRTTYVNLFNLLSTTYGSGDGSTTFNLPDLRGRIPVVIGSHAEVNTLGANDGLAVGTRTPRHNTTLPATMNVLLTHDPTVAAGGGGSYYAADDAPIPKLGPGGSRPDDTPAYFVLYGIIKY